MTIAELIVALFFLIAMATLLRPLQRFLENWFLKLFDSPHAHIIDVKEIRQKKNTEE